MAPEMILSRSETVVAPKGDYFALGMTILVLLTGPGLYEDCHRAPQLPEGSMESTRSK